MSAFLGKIRREQMRLERIRRLKGEGRPRVQPLVASVWMLAAAAVAATVIWVTTAWLLGTTNQVKEGAERASLRVEAVRTGLAAGAGTGAAIALMLAFRRQQYQEIATALTDHDATERRITDLYAKAADQLGSDKAPVRLAGLYALERLANGNPTLRQTITNVICAYLRMPYAPPSGGDRRSQARRPSRRYGGAHRSQFLEPKPKYPEPNMLEEREVRLTAERIITTHLRPLLSSRQSIQKDEVDGNSQLWRDISLDLTGATLLSFDFSHCVVSGADFTGTTFINYADFSHASFERAIFNGATFKQSVAFFDARFSHDAEFGEVTFAGNVYAQRTEFSLAAIFDIASFSGSLYFDNAKFGHLTSFDQATIDGDADFSHTQFESSPSFRKAQFGGIIDFEDALVDSLEREYGWPPGWTAELTREGAGRVIRAS
jgi:hypothetical protein